MIVSLSNTKDIKRKISGILDLAKQKGETGISVVLEESMFKFVNEFMSKDKAIGMIKVAGKTFFVIKEMRIELVKIDFYI